MPEGISLIFAGNYPDNPGSIFGHTFLKVKTSAKSRLQSQGKKRLDILDYAINYLANVTDDVGVLYAFKGLLGFYRGLYTLEPYYLKVSEYSEGEGRDIWEYELNVTSEESHFILAQYWELRYQAKFSYYFLDDNCSFHILKMLDVTKPEWKLIENNPSYVIPVETVKNLSSKIGAIKNVNFRPSIRKKAETAYNKLSFGQKSMTLELMRGEQDPKEVSDVDVINTVVLNFFSKRSLNDGKLSVKDQALMEQLLNRLAKLDTSHLSGSTFEGKSPNRES